MSKLVLHIDTGRNWGGGQKQVYYLLRGLQNTSSNNILICQPDSPLHIRVGGQGVQILPVHMHGEYDPAAAWKIARIVRDKDVALLHAHTAHAHALALLVRMFSRRDIPILVTRRVIYPPRRSWISRRKYYAENLYYIAISPAVKDVLVEYGVEASRISTVSIGFDFDELQQINQTQRERLRAELQIPADRLIIGTIGTLENGKGFDYLLRALRLLKETGTDVYCAIVGDGPEREKLENLARELEINDRVVFTGRRPDALPLLNAFDIFALPSLSEGFSNVTLEAMALGKPVVVSDVGGLHFLVRDKANGMLVPPQNPEKIAEAVRELLNNPQRRQELGQRAQADARQYSVERMIEETVRVYEKIIC